MNFKWLVALLGLCLVSPSLYAQGFIGKGARALKASRVVTSVPRVSWRPSLGARLEAAWRGQSPALKRLGAIRSYQLTKAEWRSSNSALAEELDSKGFLLQEQETRHGPLHAVSMDGITWKEADEMLVKAVQDGRPVRFDDAGKGYFSLYKDGPELEFYDERLFNELDRSRELGMTIVDRQGYITVQVPEEFAEMEIMFNGYLSQLKDINPISIVTYTHAEWVWDETGKIASPLYTPQETAERGLNISKKQGGAVETIIVDGRSVADLNDWYASFKSLATQLKPYEGRLNLGIAYTSRPAANGVEGQFFIRDSQGSLHNVEELDTVIKKEEELFQAAERADGPK